MNSDQWYESPDAWDVYEEKREQIADSIWDMSVSDFYDESDVDPHRKAIYAAVDTMACRILEEHIEGMADYAAEIKHDERKESESG